MSDREEPGREAGARDRLRDKLAEMKAAEAEGGSKIIRLPRRPRRVGDEAPEHPAEPWRSEANDPAPTRPVLRSELQRETGWWPVDPGAAPYSAADRSGDGEHEGSVVDLEALRRKRAGAPAGGGRRMAKPRRIKKDPGDAETDQVD
ncbi:hypothetical protein [Nocardia sp. NPDC048505]|uniref:hypothetical protein n=1 Tax=unclassified Nocardia TaxID=2637762 RepID=UPI0033E0562E